MKPILIILIPLSFNAEQSNMVFYRIQGNRDLNDNYCIVIDYNIIDEWQFKILNNPESLEDNIAKGFDDIFGDIFKENRKSRWQQRMDEMKKHHQESKSE